MSTEVTYRVQIDLLGAHVLCFDRADDPLDGQHESVAALPKWMQDRLAVLSILRAPPPPQDVAGVGCKVQDNVYWVYEPTTE